MKHLLITPLLLATCINAASVQAADVPSNPAQQTSWGLYIDSNEVAKMKQELGDKMLFIDVRDPIEIMFTGMEPLEPTTTFSPLQKPNSMQPSIAPCGLNLPNITAAMAMKPWPITMDGRYTETVASVMLAPPRPARKPESATQI